MVLGAALPACIILYTHPNNPNQNPPHTKHSTSAKSIAALTVKSGYRPDLKKAALARMSALKRCVPTHRHTRPRIYIRVCVGELS